MGLICRLLSLLLCVCLLTAGPAAARMGVGLPGVGPVVTLCIAAGAEQVRLGPDGRPLPASRDDCGCGVCLCASAGAAPLPPQPALARIVLSRPLACRPAAVLVPALSRPAPYVARGPPLRKAELP